MKRKYLVRATQFADPVYVDLARQMLAADDKVQVKRKDTGRLVWVTKDKANDPDYERIKDKGKEKSEGKADPGDKLPASPATAQKDWREESEGKGKKKEPGKKKTDHRSDPRYEDARKDKGDDVTEGEKGKAEKGEKSKDKPEKSKKPKQEKKDIEPTYKWEEDENKERGTNKDKGEKEEKSDAGDTKKPKKKDLSPKDLAKIRNFQKTEKAKKRLEEYKKDVADGKKPKTDKTDAQLMQEFRQEASAEMKERMKDMSPQEFMEMMAAISDEEDEMGKAATLRKDLIRLASKMKPSPERSALIQVLASHNKSAHFPYLDRRSGNLSREGIRGDGLSKSVMRGGDGFALYFIDPDAGVMGKSKFYEGMLHEQPNGLYDVKFRWGALTDSGLTGRVEGRKLDEKFSNLTYSEAKRALDKKKRAKVGKGYVDTFGPKHKDPVTGKKLKQGEYPIGLARDAPFGWGTQTMAYCVPALREIAEHISRALDPNDGTTAEADLSRAQRLVSNVPDSQMAGKINRYIAVVMREVNRGSDQAVINKKLRTLQNYIQKQVALCG